MFYRRSGDTWCGNDEFVVSILLLYIITRGVELKSTQIWQYQTDRADESSSYYQGQFRFFYSHYSKLLFLVILKTKDRKSEPVVRLIPLFRRSDSLRTSLKSLFCEQKWLLEITNPIKSSVSISLMNQPTLAFKVSWPKKLRFMMNLHLEIGRS